MRVRWRSRVADIVRSGLSLAKLSETMKEAEHHGAGVERLVGCGIASRRRQAPEIEGLLLMEFLT